MVNPMVNKIVLKHAAKQGYLSREPTIGTAYESITLIVKHVSKLKHPLRYTFSNFIEGKEPLCTVKDD